MIQPVQDPPLNPTEPDVPDADPAEPPLKWRAFDAGTCLRDSTRSHYG